jgi:hypothetical protein
MLKHIVLLKLKAGTDKKLIDDFYKGVLGLKDQIPKIESIYLGTNKSPENKDRGFTEGFEMEFIDASARNRYLENPIHKATAEKYILPIIEDIVVFDLET